MKKTSLAMAVLSASLGLLCSCQKASAAEKGFVYIEDGKFVKDGKEFRFAGTNNYYMHYSPDKMITDVLDDAQAMGVSVLRCWGFQFGVNKEHNSYGMTEPGKYGVPDSLKSTKKKPDEFGYPRDTFERLDFTIAEAKKRNIKLIIAMNNYWSDFGGIENASSWQKWFNLKDGEEFYKNAKCKAAYKEFCKYLITRKNSFTGICNNEESTIMAWELMNEPRNRSDVSGRTLTSWVKEMSAYVKELAPQQLCAVGDEGYMIDKKFEPVDGEGKHCYNGFEGSDFDSLIKIKTVDFATFHLYPETWGIAENSQEAWGEEWISKHIDSAKKVNKPVIMEEYGTSANGKLNRLGVYDAWNSIAYEKGIAGSMFWILTSSNTYEKAEGGDGIYDDYDGFRIRNDKSSVSNLLQDYATLFATGKKSETLSQPRFYLMSPAKNQEIKGVYEITAKYLCGDDKTLKAKRAELYFDGQPAPSPRTLNYNVKTNTYRIKFDTLANAKTYPDGSKINVKVVFTMSDGSTKETEAKEVTVSNKVTYSVIKKYDFATGTENAESLGAYQAELKSIEHTSLNGGMVKVNCFYAGENNWEELKVKFGKMKEVAKAAKMDFTIYYEKSKAIPHATKSDAGDKLPGVQPYIAFDPGWVKTGLKENNAFLKDVPVVKLDDGNEYYKVSVSLEFFQNPSYTFVTICPTLGFVKYNGAVYIDDVILYKKD